MIKKRWSRENFNQLRSPHAHVYSIKKTEYKPNIIREQARHTK